MGDCQARHAHRAAVRLALERRQEMPGARFQPSKGAQEAIGIPSLMERAVLGEHTA